MQFLNKAVPTAKRLFSHRAPANARFTESIPDLDRCNYASFTFARSAGPPGDQNVRTVHIYIDRGHVEFDRRGSLSPINLQPLSSTGGARSNEVYSIGDKVAEIAKCYKAPALPSIITLRQNNGHQTRTVSH